MVQLWIVRGKVKWVWCVRVYRCTCGDSVPEQQMDTLSRANLISSFIRVHPFPLTGCLPYCKVWRDWFKPHSISAPPNGNSPERSWSWSSCLHCGNSSWLNVFVLDVSQCCSVGWVLQHIVLYIQATNHTYIVMEFVPYVTVSYRNFVFWFHCYIRNAILLNFHQEQLGLINTPCKHLRYSYIWGASTDILDMANYLAAFCARDT